MTFNLDRFIEECLEAAVDANEEERVRQLLQSAVDDPGIGDAVPITDEDETLLHESAELTVYSLRLTPRILYPPHDHRMTAIIGLFEGDETNYLFRRDGMGLVRTAVHESSAPEVVVLPPDTIHAVTNRGKSFSRAIHVYLGSLTKVERSVWSADGTGERPFDNIYYFEQARDLTD